MLSRVFKGPAVFSAGVFMGPAAVCAVKCVRVCVVCA